MGIADMENWKGSRSTADLNELLEDSYNIQEWEPPRWQEWITDCIMLVELIVSIVTFRAVQINWSHAYYKRTYEKAYKKWEQKRRRKDG